MILDFEISIKLKLTGFEVRTGHNKNKIRHNTSIMYQVAEVFVYAFQPSFLALFSFQFQQPAH